MIRVVIENIVLFLLPALVYLGYMYAVRRGTPDEGRVIEDAPIAWLFAAGAALVIVTLVAFSSTSGNNREQAYEPARIEGGRIQPGQ